MKEDIRCKQSMVVLEAIDTGLRPGISSFYEGRKISYA
jgi:hypothetical protein